MFIAPKMRPNFGCITGHLGVGVFQKKKKKRRILRTWGPHSSSILRSSGGQSPRPGILSTHVRCMDGAWNSKMCDFEREHKSAAERFAMAKRVVQNGHAERVKAERWAEKTPEKNEEKAE